MSRDRGGLQQFYQFKRHGRRGGKSGTLFLSAALYYAGSGQTKKLLYLQEAKPRAVISLKFLIWEKDTDGSPKYWYRAANDLADYDYFCNEDAYKAGTSTPDCRQFNDDAGTVYYKLLAKTIAVSGSVRPIG